MKAIVYDKYGSVDVLELKDIDRPLVKDDEVLVRVRAASANPLDWHFMRGQPYIMRPQSGLRSPKRSVRGNDMAGKVEAVGKNVTRFRPGDEVMADVNGSFAECTCVSEDVLGLKPANLTFEQAASVPVAGVTALQGLRDGGQPQADLPQARRPLPDRAGLQVPLPSHGCLTAGTPAFASIDTDFGDSSLRHSS